VCPADIVFRDQLGNRLPKIPEKTLGHIYVSDHAPGEYREVSEEVVTPAAAKFLEHPRRPVLGADFPTIDVGSEKNRPG
jgi:hypothetical protein